MCLSVLFRPLFQFDITEKGLSFECMSRYSTSFNADGFVVRNSFFGETVRVVTLGVVIPLLVDFIAW